MAVTVDELRSVMRMELGPYTRDLQRLHGINAATAKRLEDTWRGVNSRFNRLGENMARNITAPLAGIATALTTREVAHYADAWTSAKNSLAVAGVTGQRQVAVLDALYDAAQRNAAPIGALANLYGKAAQAGDVLGASQEEIIKFSGGVATALRVAGTGAGAASGALTQLGQLLGSTRVQAEEFNSVNEGARPILMAVAAGLDEAGGSVSKLKQLVNDGKVSGRQFFDAFLKGLPEIEKMAANSTQTIEQGWTKVDNALTKYIGSTDESLGASERLVAGLNALADNFKTVADGTLILAGVIAGALVGRSMAQMLVSLGLGSKALLNLAKAIAAARTMASLSVAMGGLSAAAGPVGLVIGTVLTGALIAFGTRSGEASSAAETYARALEKVKVAAEKAGEAVEQAEPKFVERQKNDLSQGIGVGTDKIDDARRAVVEYLRDVSANAPRRLISDAQLKQLDALAKGLENGSKSAEEADDAIHALANSNPKFQTLAKQFRPLIDELKRALGATELLKSELADLGGMGGGRDWNRLGTAISERDKKRDFLSQEVADAQRTENQKKIDAETLAVMKRAEEAGVKLTEAAARLQAVSNLADRDAVAARERTASSAAEVIKGFESFRSTPYWDVNAYRVGYGSDTVTLDDGSIQRVTQGISVSVADANRDLERRIGEFQTGIRQRIGSSTFEAMSSDQQAALTSIAYNYGSLPDRIVAAIKTGNDQTVYQAIKGLGGDNAGINRKRRDAEAEMYLGGTSPITQAEVKGREGFDARLQEQRAMIAALQAETAIRASLNPLVDDYGRAMSTVQAAQYLLNAAMQEGTAAGRELKDVQQLLYGDLSSLSPAAREQAEAMRQLAMETGNAEAAGTRLSAAQQDIRRSAEEWASVSRDVTKGFIKDLMDGKSAAEALAGALQKVADKLLDDVLDAIFQVNSAGGGGGGFLSSIFGGLFGGGFNPIGKVGLFSAGGYTGHGGKYAPAGVVHKGEYVFDQESVRAAGGPSALDDVRRRLRGYSGGGSVGDMINPRIPMPKMPAIPQVGAASGMKVEFVSRFDADGNFESKVERISTGVADRRAAAHVKHYDRTRAGQTAVDAMHSYQERRG
ncbi:hypothetical protein GCM10007923_63490 [Shinella yambaruensis]|uniref:Lysozyme n=1 Tax=Shinella yambaruensis TaxID=415996 RepID=A0ABQ5ZWZ0_9HYPH|nr:hypothetical protein GCM10007923_63490 [Shinella yambaruensis]